MLEESINSQSSSLIETKGDLQSVKESIPDLLKALNTLEVNLDSYGDQTQSLNQSTEQIYLNAQDNNQLIQRQLISILEYFNPLSDEKEVVEDEIIIEREFIPLENDSDKEL
ncbi:unnamed protein product [Brachionus calyciflorus]|uniref:Uncharacterized protein n=1 Tax=Brachionus calyciflorus TaxID=104777 RepID=A0A813XLJ4_9BILA|nr:unnamed protein product [Brachionus calyciflorus]